MGQSPCRVAQTLRLNNPTCQVTLEKEGKMGSVWLGSSWKLTLVWLVGWEFGVAFLGSGTWESVYEGPDVMLKSYNNFFWRIWRFITIILKEEKKKGACILEYSWHQEHTALANLEFGVFSTRCLFQNMKFLLSKFYSGSRSRARGAEREASLLFQCLYHYTINNSLGIPAQLENSTFKLSLKYT